MASNNTVEKYGIVQFDGNDYDHWKFRMKVILDQHEVKECIERERADPDDAFTKKDRKCKSLIIQCIANSHLQYVKDKANAYQMWRALEAVFQRKGIASQLYLQKRLLSMKLIEGKSLEKHFLKFEETVRELKTVGAKLEEMDIVCHLLLTLPKDYDAIVTALETLEVEKLTLEFVKGKLLDQEIKNQNQQETVSSDASAAVSSNLKNTIRDNHNKQQSNQRNSRTSNNSTTSLREATLFKCHNCGKAGYKRSECTWRKQANQTNLDKSEKGQHITFLAMALQSMLKTGETTMRLYIDSGATDHMVNSEKYFSNVRELENPIKIYVAKSNEFLYATKISNINILLKDNNNYSTAKITNVLYVKNLRHNLLSVYRLGKVDLKVIFKGDNVFIMKDLDLLARGKRENNLYQIEFKIMQTEETNMCKNLENMQIWHKRLGYLRNQNLLKLSRHYRL
ncbi:copia protein [Lasius niger]|uniref:Copia protein n=1 Tax=Lasius niger TaxID=67767 RepID=A0A0J7JYG5_LASNI|nr:copia protein [Lasius niger]